MRAQGHSLTYMAQANLVESVCTRDVQQPSPAILSWSGSPWFDLARKGSWRVQQWLGIPYLNVFSSLRHYDACLHCLPGHDVVYERSGLYKGGVARACKQLGLPMFSLWMRMRSSNTTTWENRFGGFCGGGRPRCSAIAYRQRPA